MEKFQNLTFTKILLFIGVLFLASCGSKKSTVKRSNKRPTVTVDSKSVNKAYKRDIKESRGNTADNVITTAMTFTGTRYKFGGITKKGMDCSGLIYVSLLEHDVAFPRVSYQMANEGERVNLKNVRGGDLLFFKTSKNSKRINHVGLVVAVNGDDIKFIHSTTSRGVIVSSLREGFWNSTFIKATRIL